MHQLFLPFLICPSFLESLSAPPISLLSFSHFRPLESTPGLVPVRKTMQPKHLFATSPTFSRLSIIFVFQPLFPLPLFHCPLSVPLHLLLLIFTLRKSDLLHSISRQCSQPRTFHHALSQPAIFVIFSRYWSLWMCAPGTTSTTIYRLL